jgi:molecular chaperone DnaK
MKSDYKDKLSEEDIKSLDESITESKSKVESTEKDVLEAAVKALSDKIMPIGAKMYEQAQKEDAAAKPDSEEKDNKSDDNEEVVEGEVVDEDKPEEKKE